MDEKSQVGLAGADVNPGIPQISYYVSNGDDGQVDGLFRVVKDDSAQTLDMQYLTEDGWVDEPGLIDMLREPGVRPVTDEQELMEIRKALYFGGPDDDPAGGGGDEDVPDAAASEPAPR